MRTLSKIIRNCAVSTLIWHILLLVQTDLRWWIFAFVIVTLIVFATFYSRKNNKMVVDMVALPGGLMLALVYKYASMGKLVDKITGLLSNLSCADIAITIIFIIILYKYYNPKSTKFSRAENKSDSKYVPKELFEERQFDLARIKQYLKEEQITALGINAPWGNGKTFLIEKLKEDLVQETEHKYEFIEMDILSTTLDNVLEKLINELNLLLRKYGILSSHSGELLRYFSNERGWGSIYAMLFGNNSGYSYALRQFKKEILELNSIIIIYWEDMDRVKDPDIIRKILYIGERLSDRHIKFVYQYNGQEMGKLGFPSMYLDKYIPFHVKLTSIDIVKIINLVCKEIDFDNNCINVRKYMYKITPTSFYIMDGFVPGIIVNTSLQTLLSGRFTVRTVEHYLYELKWYCTNNKVENEAIVVWFYFIKHFLPELFQLLSYEKSLLDWLKVRILEKDYDIPILQSEDVEKYKTIFTNQNNELNLQKYLAFKLLGVENTLCLTKEKPYKPMEFRNRYLYHSTVNISDFTKDEHIDYMDLERQIFNLLEAGKPKHNDYTESANDIAAILKKPNDKWMSTFDKWLDDIYQGKLNYNSIFFFGLGRWEQIFQAYYVAAKKWNKDEGEQNYINILTYYFDVDVKPIGWSQYLADDLNYCFDGIHLLGNRKCTIFILRRLSSIQVNCNLQNIVSFRHLMGKSILALFSTGYIQKVDTFAVRDCMYCTENEAEQYMKMLKIIFEDVKKEINIMLNFFREENEESYQSEVDEYKIIVEYLKVIGKILECKELIQAQQEEPSVDMKMNSIPNKDEERLVTMTDSDFENNMQNSNFSPVKKYRLIKRRRKKN